LACSQETESNTTKASNTGIKLSKLTKKHIHGKPKVTSKNEM